MHNLSSSYRRLQKFDLHADVSNPFAGQAHGQQVGIIIIIIIIYDNRIRINSVLWPKHTGQATRSQNALQGATGWIDGGARAGQHPKKRIRSRRGRE